MGGREGARGLNRRTVVLGAAGVVLLGCAPRPTGGLTVFAAISLSEVFTAIAPGGTRFNFAASSTLARQIDAGAQADVYASADPDWLFWLQRRGWIDRGGSRPFAANRLAVVTPGSGAPAPASAADVAASAQRLAIADPAHVPAGRYAEQSLRALGIWPEVAPHLVATQDVRAALKLVSLGEADAGVVYASDAQAAGAAVRVVDLLPADSHAEIVYLAASLKNAPHPDRAAAFVESLQAPHAQEVMSAAGFLPPRRGR